MVGDTLSNGPSIRLGNFRLDRQSGLYRVGPSGRWEPVAIGSRALDLLAALAGTPGELVSKQVLMEAAWPGMAVEDANLTVQISALRRLLDEGRAESCIQTVVGRGYRLLPERLPDAGVAETPAVEPVPQSDRMPAAVPASGWPARRWLWFGGLGTALAALLLVAAARLGNLHSGKPPPRMSLVVLPFQNLDGDTADDYLADAIGNELTTDLSRLSGAFVIARESALSYKGKHADIRQVGQELQVRYAVEGSVRRLGDVLRVNARLVSTETGAQIWGERFEEPIRDLAGGQEAIVRHIAPSLGYAVADVESARSLRDRPTDPDAFDLMLRARSIRNQVETGPRLDQLEALYKQALELDPSSVGAMMLLYGVYYGRRIDLGYWPSAEMQAHAAELLARAQALAPSHPSVLIAMMRRLIMESRWPELLAASQRLIDADPNQPYGYANLARAKMFTGKAEEAIPLLEKAIRLNPRELNPQITYNRLGTAFLLSGRYEEAILWQRRALAANPDAPALQLNDRLQLIAAAQALSGRLEDASATLTEGTRIWPYSTLRLLWGGGPSNPVYAGQVRRYLEGLRVAGLRDHADEDADFGVTPDGALRSSFYGWTPARAPGVTTIRTPDLVRLIRERKPLVIDTARYSLQRSIPGAVGLREAGTGGTFSDPIQARLSRKMLELTKGDQDLPIVAAGVNSERFDGWNLALRLAALGYRNVYWYRGGHEAWEVNLLPETRLDLQDW
jgi:adenylate cyclase